MGGIDNATWQALGLILTTLGLGTSVLVWRRRGTASGLRGVAWSLLPLAAALTGTLRLLWEIADSIGSWAVRLVFSPVVWLGIVLAGVSLLLFVVSGVLRGRTTPTDRRSRRPQLPAEPSRPAAAGTPAAGQDDDLADIEAILRKHGIS